MNRWFNEPIWPAVLHAEQPEWIQGPIHFASIYGQGFVAEAIGYISLNSQVIGS